MLSSEDILHVARLAHLSIKDEEIETYKKELNTIWNDVNKINSLEEINTDILISPTENKDIAREDVSEEMISIKELKVNAPSTSGNFIKVVKALND